MPTIDSTPSSSGTAAATSPRKTKQQQQGQRGEGDQLGLGEVLARLVVDVLEPGRVAGHRHVEQRGVHALACLVRGDAALLLDVDHREAGRQDQRAAVGRDEALALTRLRQGVDHPSDVAGLLELPRQARDLGADRRALGVQPAAVLGPHEHDDARVGVAAERLAHHLGGALALGGGVGEARGLEMVLDVVADGDGADRERRDDGAARGGDDARSDPAMRSNSDALRAFGWHRCGQRTRHDNPSLGLRPGYLRRSYIGMSVSCVTLLTCASPQ